jgi:Secretory lipase
VACLKNRSVARRIRGRRASLIAAAKIFVAAVASGLTAVAVGAALASGATAIAFATAASTPVAPAPAAVTGPSVGDGGVSAFYVWQDALPAAPGSMLREEPLSPTQRQSAAAQNLRILYTSTNGVGRHDRLVAVSGALYLPNGVMPKGGWPLVAWAHGTTGIADVCAPSWRGQSRRDQVYLDAWLSHGFAVVATDYEGLGTPGIHPYLLWRSEGYAVLDAIRAVLQRHPRQLRNQVVVVGQSQGSGAALGATFLSTTYAPQLHVLGTVATGLVVTFHPDAHVKLPPKPAQYTDPTLMDPAYAILRIAGTDRSLHPETDTAEFVTAKGRPLLHAALTSCVHDLFDLSAREKFTGAEVFTGNLATIDSDMEANFEFPSARMPVPIFVGTGLADGEAGTAQQYNAVAGMCAAGTSVEWHTYPGLTHNGAVNSSLRDSLPFVQRLMSGKAGQGSCGHVEPLGPPQKADPSVPFND